MTSSPPPTASARRVTRAAGRAALGLAALLLLASGAAARPWGVLKDDRPARLGPSPARAPFDCSGAVEVAIAAGSGVLQGTTVGTANLNAGYACVAWNESGGEAVYHLTVSADLVLYATLQDLGAADLDIFLLSACNGDACLAAGSNAFAVRLAPGGYYLVVDGYEGASGSFTIAWRAGPTGVPESICTGGATPVVCASTPFAEVGASLWEKPNLVETDACATYLERGGEAWYAVTLADSSAFTAEVLNPQFDAALWLYGGCGPQAECLGFVDAAVTGGAEELTWRNIASERRTVYLAVDALHPPADAFAASYDLQITCTKPVVVPVEAASWGALKSLYGGSPRR